MTSSTVRPWKRKWYHSLFILNHLSSPNNNLKPYQATKKNHNCLLILVKVPLTDPWKELLDNVSCQISQPTAKPLLTGADNSTCFCSYESYFSLSLLLICLLKKDFIVDVMHVAFPVSKYELLGKWFLISRVTMTDGKVSELKCLHGSLTLLVLK